MHVNQSYQADPEIADNAVTTDKLAIGATVAQGTGTWNVNVGQVVTTSQVTVVETSTFLSRNSPVLLTGYISLACVMGGAAISTLNTLTIWVYGFNTTFGEALLQTLDVEASLFQTAATLVHVPAVVPFTAW